MTIQEKAKQWLFRHCIGLRQRTTDSYESTLRLHIVPRLGEYELDSEELPDKIAELLQEAQEKNPRTAEMIYVTLRAMLRSATEDPMRDIGRPRYKPKPVQAWSDDEIRRYYRAIEGTKHELPLMIAIATGMRRGEICALQWEDIDLEGRRIYVHRQAVRSTKGLHITEPKTEAGIRMIPIQDGLIDRLRRSWQSSGPICTVTPEQLYRVHRKICVSAGLPVLGLHGLRHSYATCIVRNGGSISGLQKILGHSHYSTTADVYAPPEYAMERACVDVYPCCWMGVSPDS